MSNITAFYLKYRPQTLTELIGQESVKQTIAEAFKSNKLSHAYLFVGPRGTGKTSLARILAKMVNCERTTNVPCNKCSTCISITDGSNLDLIEIDAASNRGVEDIRMLRERIKLSPTGAKKKVYIIDEVHMLTTEAFNALLKTLEEPPAHAFFILATTEAGKLPQTILSRCQRLDFKLARGGEILEALQKIVRLEKINIEEAALKLLVKKAEGSFRDGVKLLDQVSSLGGKITAEILEKNLKSSNFDDILSLLESFAEKNAKKGLAIILRKAEEGLDVKELMLSLMDSLRNLVFIKNELGEKLVSPNLGEDKYEQLVKVSASFSNRDLVRILEILQNSLEKLKFATIASLPLELAVVEICGEEIDGKLDIRSEKMDKEVRDLKLENQTSNIQSQDLPSNVQYPTSNDDSADIQKIKEKWTYVCETIRPYNFSLEALLRSVRISDITEINVIMEVPYSFHQRILEAPKNRDILEGILSDVLGRQIKVSCILGNRPIQREDLANIEVAEDDEIVRIASEIFNSDSVN